MLLVSDLASSPTLHNNNEFNLTNHQTKTRIKRECRQNSYIQTTIKAMQDTHFQNWYTVPSLVTPGKVAQHTNPP
jgi:hypothetical protein